MLKSKFLHLGFSSFIFLTVELKAFQRLEIVRYLFNCLYTFIYREIRIKIRFFKICVFFQVVSK